MARKKKKTARKRRTMRVRRPRRSTRKGAIRRTSRRAYVAPPKRRRAKRRNPKPIWETPAIKYAAWASVGAGLGMAGESAGWFSQAGGRFVRSAMLAVAIGLVARYGLKGRNRQNGYAVAAGALIPAVGSAIADQLGPMLTMGGSAASAALGNNNNNNNNSNNLPLPPTDIGRSHSTAAYSKRARGLIN